MKKKYFIIRLILFVILVVLFSSSRVLAYTNEAYYVDIPENFTNGRDAIFYDENGNTIMFYYTESKINFYNEKYTEEDLNTLLKYLTSENVNDEYLCYFSLEDVVLKEIMDLSKNNYQCFHIIYEYKHDAIMDGEGNIVEEENVHQYNQYYIFNNNIIYTILTLGDIPDSILDSFTINIEYPLDNNKENILIQNTENKGKFYYLFSIINWILLDSKIKIIISIICVVIGTFGIRFLIKNNK